MSEFIASAEIAIIPNTRGFRNALIAELGAMKEVPVPVKVTPDTKAFRKELVTVLTTMKVPPVMVPVKPNMVGFEKDLRARVAAIAERVSANVKVTAGAARQTTTGGGGGGATRTRRPAPVLSDTGKPLFGAAAAAKTEARAREKEQLAAIQKVQAAEIKAHAANIARDKARAAADEKARLQVLADLEKQGLLSSTGKPLTGAARDAKLEANARVEANAEALKQMQADEIAAHKRNDQITQRSIAAETKARLKARAELERQGLIGRGGRPLTGAARDAVLEKQARSATREAQITASQTQATKVLTQARTAEITIANAEIGAMNKLEAARAREAVAQKLATEATVARQTAERLGLKTTAEAIAVEEALALSRLETEQTTLRAAVGEVNLAKRRSFFTRAVGAQSAAFAGLRGAVLAANPAFIAGTVAAVAFGKAVSTAASFESELSVFRVTAGATALEMEKVAAAAQRLGRDVTLPGVAATDAAETMTSLAKAGLSVEDSLAGARGVLQLATAAAISNAEATELAASALNAFGLAGTDAVRVADTFANSANAAQGTITDVGIALQQAAAVARQVGVSFEDTVALLTLLARNGIRGSDAGTSLRVAFTRLVAPTAQAAAVLDDLNVAVRDSQGNLRPEVFSDIAVAMQGMTRAQQDANAKIIFGVDALRAYSIVSREGISSLNATRDNLAQQGTAAELAAARMAGLTGAAENLKNQLAALGLVLGQTVLPVLTSTTDTIASLVGVVNAVVGPLAEIGGDIKGVFDEIKEATSFEIAGFEIGPLQSIPETLRGASDLIQNQFKKSVIESKIEVIQLAESFNKVGGIVELDKTIRQLREVQTSLQGGGEDAEKFAADIGALINQLQEDSADEDIDLGELKIEIPPDLLRGEPGRIAAEAAKKAFQDEMGEPFPVHLDPVFNLSSRFTQQGLDAFRQAGEAWRREMAAQMSALSAEIRDATGRLNVLAGEALQIEIEGGPNVLQRLLRNAQAAQPELEAQVGRARQQLKPGQKSSPALREAQAALKANLDEQKRIREEMQAEVDKNASDAEKAAKDLKDKLDAADQALIDSFAPSEAAVRRRATIAEGTPGLQDDIAAARARKRQLLQQISVIRADFNNRRDAAEEIRARRQEILEIEQKIAQDTASSRDQITETLSKRIELAQLQGGRGAILKAIDNAIKDAKDRVKNWKKLGLVLLDEQIELARLVKSRKEFLNDLTGGESPDVFVDRLFREAVDQFRRFGGNISTGGAGIISPQQARGQFASILTGNGRNVTNLTERTAQRTRDASLAEERKQTAYLRIIAGGPRTKFVRGAPIPPEAAKTAVEIGGNVLKGL